MQVTCGPTTTAAISDDGVAFVWGNNAQGMLGLGVPDATVPMPSELSLPAPAVDIAMGAMHGLVTVKAPSGA